jgi:polyhydroxyalkanoate synthesis regulator phasin
MKSIKMRGICAAVAGALMFGFGANAMADSTTDIVNALVAKGVLTEEEGALLNKGREGEAAGQAKALKKASKLKVSDAIDNAELYGDIRVRYEHREGTGTAGVGSVSSTAGSGATAIVAGADENRERARYKVTMGVKTEAGKWNTDLALAMGANGRSDNATFGKSATSNINDKETLFVKRAMVGYKATDWLTLEAGRMTNPLYTTPMVWDADLTVEGLSEKFKYKANDNLELFGVAGQWSYQGDRKNFDGTSGDTLTTTLFAFQGGANYKFTDSVSAKAGVTYINYGNNTSTAKFNPGTSTVGSSNNTNTASSGTGIGYQNKAAGVNNLNTIEIPAEVNFMATSNIGIRAFGDYAWNTDADARAVGAGQTGSSGSDDTAWMLGVMVGSAKDLKSFEGNKMKAGDWSARLWYQDVGVWSVDPNAVDSDFMDSRVNMQGTTFKAKYNIEDNVTLDLAYGHAKRKNNSYGSAGAASDLALNLDSFDLFQFDVTYKF